jgi:hypothetical protein
MNLEMRAYSIAAVICLAIVLVIGFLIWRFVAKTIFRVILLVVLGVVGVVVWYLMSAGLLRPIANSMWEDPSVPCFLLNEENCEKRDDCSLSLTYGGLGRDVKFCASNK